MTAQLDRDAILAMEAGPELDAEIAIRVMSQQRTGDCPLDDERCPGKYEPMAGRWPCLPPYSTDIAAAWQIVEKLRLCVLSVSSNNYPPTAWMVGGNDDKGYFNEIFGTVEMRMSNAVVAPTAPLAICRAALLTTLEAG